MERRGEVREESRSQIPERLVDPRETSALHSRDNVKPPPALGRKVTGSVKETEKTPVRVLLPELPQEKTVATNRVVGCREADTLKTTAGVRIFKSC